MAPMGGGTQFFEGAHLRSLLKYAHQKIHKDILTPQESKKNNN